MHLTKVITTSFSLIILAICLCSCIQVNISKGLCSYKPKLWVIDDCLHWYSGIDLYTLKGYTISTYMDDLTEITCGFNIKFDKNARMCEKKNLVKVTVLLLL